MKESSKNYFTTGELSCLCKIPRKTLLYYDRLGLIAPELIDENGYRYYKRSQIFLLQLILALRRLEVPIAEIKSYTENKSLDNYRALLRQQDEYFARRIAELQSLRQELRQSRKHLAAVGDAAVDEVRELDCPEEFLYLSRPVSSGALFKERSSIYAELFVELAAKRAPSDHIFGTIVDKSLFAGGGHFAKYYYIPLNSRLDDPNCFVKAAGRYAVLFFRGVYMHCHQPYTEMLRDYCRERGLEPLSDMYVTSLQNYWTTNDLGKYVYKLEVRVG